MNKSPYAPKQTTVESLKKEMKELNHEIEHTRSPQERLRLTHIAMSIDEEIKEKVNNTLQNDL